MGESQALIVGRVVARPLVERARGGMLGDRAWTGIAPLTRLCADPRVEPEGRLSPLM